MEILSLIMIFFLGTVFGSFFTLAVYRIPLNKNITHERSFCPNCNHRLEFLDLIPVWSYIFLGGKCRYCKQKVRLRYLILEILSGLFFVIAYKLIKIDVLGISYLYLGINYQETVQKIVFYIAVICFYITNAIIIGIDNEYKNINLKVLIFGIVTEALYTIYLKFYLKLDISGCGICLIGSIILLFINKKFEKYIIQNIAFLLYILQFIDIKNIGILMSLFLIIYTIYSVYTYIKAINRLNKENNNNSKNEFNSNLQYKIHQICRCNVKIPLGFCLGISAIITQLLLLNI